MMLATIVLLYVILIRIYNMDKKLLMYACGVFLILYALLFLGSYFQTGGVDPQMALLLILL